MDRWMDVRKAGKKRGREWGSLQPGNMLPDLHKLAQGKAGEFMDQRFHSPLFIFLVNHINLLFIFTTYRTALIEKKKKVKQAGYKI